MSNKFSSINTPLSNLLMLLSLGEGISIYPQVWYYFSNLILNINYFHKYIKFVIRKIKLILLNHL